MSSPPESMHADLPGTLQVRSLRCEGRHGAYPGEQETAREFLVDLDVDVDLAPAIGADRLDETLDFAQVAAAVRSVVAGAPRDLLESVAHAIATRLLEAFPRVTRVRVRLAKPEPPGLGAAEEAVELSLERPDAQTHPVRGWLDADVARTRHATGAPWEPIVGYSRTVRVGRFVWVSGTTALDESGEVVGVGDPYAQTRQALVNVAHALAAVGASLENVVRTRMFVTDIAGWEPIGRAHGEFFGAIRPATTMVQVARLISEKMLVEIEADAVIGAADGVSAGD